MSQYIAVAPREGRVSRNEKLSDAADDASVAPREGRVSRNFQLCPCHMIHCVAPREGRVSRNQLLLFHYKRTSRRAPRGACE